MAHKNDVGPWKRVVSIRRARGAWLWVAAYVLKLSCGHLVYRDLVRRPDKPRRCWQCAGLARRRVSK